MRINYGTRLLSFAVSVAAGWSLCCAPLVAQTPQPNAAISATGVFEGVTLGEPVANLRATLGDPIRVVTSPGTTIWRYLTHGGAAFLDLIVKNNVATSITLLSRSSDLQFTDPNGIALGATPERVRAKLGKPPRENTNADDGSLDLWYYALPYAWIYEFNNEKLTFVQVVATPKFAATFPPGPPATVPDGSTPQQAIWIRPADSTFVTMWIGAFLGLNSCPGADPANDAATPYLVVHARCTTGSKERDFYFDTHGSTAASAPQQSAATVQVSGADIVTLLKAVEASEKSPDIKITIGVKAAAEMPAYDPLVHFAGVDPKTNAATIWLSTPIQKTPATANALHASMELACMATGFAGPKWKSIYDSVASQDAALPAGAEPV
ncbi:MAG TPA: hypothetical protein VGF18_06730 [Candidatus Tumulicola sp.]